MLVSFLVVTLSATHDFTITIITTNVVLYANICLNLQYPILAEP